MISMRTAVLVAFIAVGVGALMIAQPFGGGMVPGMMGGAYGYGPGQMMGHPAYGMGPRMMWGGNGYGPGNMMRPGMMGYPGYGMGPGMMWGDGRYQRWADTGRVLTVDQVKGNLERWLVLQGNDRLKAGEVVQKNENTIEASIVTKKENAVVQIFTIDRKTGVFQPKGE